MGFRCAGALLTGVERVRFGFTTSLLFLGGGDMLMRTDDPVSGDDYSVAVGFSDAATVSGSS